MKTLNKTNKVDKDLLFSLLEAKAKNEIFYAYEFYKRFEYEDGYGQSLFYSTEEAFPITATKLWKEFIKLLHEQRVKEEESSLEGRCSCCSFVFKKEEQDKEAGIYFIKEEEYKEQQAKIKQEYSEYYKIFEIKYNKMLDELIDILEKSKV